jgi:tRNA pseudouridine38-40 synthase
MSVQRYLLKVRYDGRGFAGYQFQPGLRTVQGELEEALEELLSTKISLTCAGRTDKGVHALGQVVRLKLPEDSASGLRLSELNRKLSPAIRIVQMAAAPAGFHPRHSALSRTYSYLVRPDCQGDNTLPEGVLAVPDSLDLGKMRAAARLLEGEHDFSTFSYRSGRTSNVRELNSVSIDSQAGVTRIRFRGKGFLRKMVRLMVAGLLECGRGRLQPSELARLLEARNPKLAPHPAPSYALYLESVEYEPDPFSGCRDLDGTEAGIHPRRTETAQHGSK